ncbi:MAG: hypothetical protein IV085_04325 [Thiobacillus sp.]|nr:hypothetical protein [Thiobacillus sp.]
MRQSIVELAMKRAAKQHPPSASPAPAVDAERATARRVHDDMFTRRPCTESVVPRAATPLFPRVQPDRDFDSAPSHRTGFRPLLRVASHTLAAATGAALMWFVIHGSIGTPSPAPPATAAPQIATAPSGAPAILPDAAAKVVPQEAQVREMLERWRQAWSDRAVGTYLGFYSAQFAPADGTKRSMWEDSRRQNLLSRSTIDIQLHDITVTPLDDRQVKVTLLQDYESGSYQETRQPKTFLLTLDGNEWRIAGEWQGLRSHLSANQD